MHVFVNKDTFLFFCHLLYVFDLDSDVETFVISSMLHLLEQKFVLSLFPL